MKSLFITAPGVVVVGVVLVALQLREVTALCSPGFDKVYDSCYHTGIKLNFQSCLDYCATLNTGMASLESCSEHESLADYLLLNTNEANIMVGGVLDVKTKQWSWVSGSPLPLGPPQWAYGHPGQDQTSLIMVRKDNYKFYEASPTSTHMCLCEEPFARGEEGHSRQDEQRASQESQKVSKCPKPFHDLQGICILFHEEKATWASAREYCRNNGGDLAAITTCEEHAKIVRRIKALEKTDGSYWVGAKGALSFYEWVTGEPVKLGPSLWQPGFPKLADGCVELFYGNDFYARDLKCSEVSYAVCQYFPPEE
ncbi:macrophage mannose receptor 1-like [Oratosquilla oratoria]|uniref:macrophage mannose receptor 1-like n=1 Tax=Oratosquilla oratoria TaxID=337810 RepID=UPI003F7692F4